MNNRVDQIASVLVRESNVVVEFGNWLLDNGYDEAHHVMSRASYLGESPTEAVVTWAQENGKTEILSKYVEIAGRVA